MSTEDLRGRCTDYRGCDDAHCAVPRCRRHVEDGVACVGCLIAVQDAVEEIIDALGHLFDQAIHGTTPTGRSLACSPIPGGDATVMAGPSADPEAVSHRRAAGAFVEDDDEETPVYMLSRWADVLRTARGLATPIDRSPGVDIRVVQESLAWLAIHGERHTFARLHADLHDMVRRLEVVLGGGGVRMTTPVPCRDCGTDMLRVVGESEYQDGLECPRRTCGTFVAAEDVKALVTDYTRDGDTSGAWVAVVDAAKVVGRPEITLRDWVRRGVVRSSRDSSNRLTVWWADVLDEHGSRAQRRTRKAAS